MELYRVSFALEEHFQTPAIAVYLHAPLREESTDTSSIFK